MVATYNFSCSYSDVMMIDVRNLTERMRTRQLSQSELARRIGMSQQSISRILSGEVRESRRLHLIARELGTSPAYLTGETDDPDEGAPPPTPEPRVQYVTLPVALPSEDMLTLAFAAILKASPRLHGDELARELARRLPTALGIARLPTRPQAPADDDAEAAADPAPADDQPLRRRA